jgi:predicted Zn-dependent protease
MPSAHPVTRMTSGQAVHRLHTALPCRVNFTLGRHEWTHAHTDSEGERERTQSPRTELEWCVVVQLPGEQMGDSDTYLDTCRGEDLGAVVEDAIARFRRWADGRVHEGAERPPKLAAPGSADVADAARKQRDVS